MPLPACLQAAFLIPVSVCIYTSLGGLKATFLSSYIHTVIIYVALCIFAFTVYATGPDLGSPKKVRGAQMLAAASSCVGRLYQWPSTRHRRRWLKDWAHCSRRDALPPTRGVCTDCPAMTYDSTAVLRS